MKKYLAFPIIIFGLGMTVVGGCRSSAECPGCGSPNYAPQSYAPANTAPAYDQNYQQPYNQGNSSGSGTRRAPLSQGSGTR